MRRDVERFWERWVDQLGCDVSETKVTTKWTDNHLCHAFLEEDKALLGVNWNIWEEMEPERRIVSVMHLGCHMLVDGHDWNFWEVFGENWVSFDPPDEYRDLERWIAQDAIRCDSEEMIQGWLDYDPEWTRALDLEEVEFSLGWTPSTEVSIEKLNIDTYTDRELYRYLRGLETGAYTTWIPTIRANPGMDGIEIESGEKAAALLKRTGEHKVPIYI